jgi:hypothetical protein
MPHAVEQQDNALHCYSAKAFLAPSCYCSWLLLWHSSVRALAGEPTSTSSLSNSLCYCLCIARGRRLGDGLSNALA